MDVLRVDQNPWGQEILQGLSWDLIWLFVGAGVVFIVLHTLYKALWVPLRDKR